MVLSELDVRNKRSNQTSSTLANRIGNNCGHEEILSLVPFQLPQFFIKLNICIRGIPVLTATCVRNVRAQNDTEALSIVSDAPPGT